MKVTLKKPWGRQKLEGATVQAETGWTHSHPPLTPSRLHYRPAVNKEEGACIDDVRLQGFGSVGPYLGANRRSPEVRGNM
jgi:hypothetical protein